MSPVKAALAALRQHDGDVDKATAETGLLRSFVADIARQFADYLRPRTAK